LYISIFVLDFSTLSAQEMYPFHNLRTQHSGERRNNKKNFVGHFELPKKTILTSVLGCRHSSRTSLSCQNSIQRIFRRRQVLEYFFVRKSPPLYTNSEQVDQKQRKGSPWFLQYASAFQILLAEYICTLEDV
jgi:hypothetical protein